MTKEQEIDYAWKYWKLFRSEPNYRDAEIWLSYLYGRRVSDE